MSDSQLPPLSELFLLIPEHRRIIQGESKRTGVTGEASSLKRGLIVLTVLLVGWIVVFTILSVAAPSFELSAFVIGLVPPIVVLAGALFLIYRRYQCLGTLETTGTLLTGRIISVKSDQAVTSNGMKTALRLRYEFTTPQGRRLEREEAQLRENLKELPAIGTPVAVMYSADNCFRVL